MAHKEEILVHEKPTEVMVFDSSAQEIDDTVAKVKNIDVEAVNAAALKASLALTAANQTSEDFQSVVETTESGYQVKIECLPILEGGEGGYKIKEDYLPETAGGSGLPEVTAEDNDKILQVVNGAWQVLAISDSAVKTYVDDYINSALEGEY